MDKNISLHRAISADVETLLFLEESTASLTTYASLLDTEKLLNEINQKVTYLIKNDDEIVGSLKYTITDDTAQISRVIIHPDFQHQGIGRKSMELILEELNHIKKIWLVAHPHNSRAVSLYLSLGFNIESWHDNYYGSEPRIILSLVK